MMKRWGSTLLGWTYLILAVAAIAWVGTTSPTFQKCLANQSSPPNSAENAPPASSSGTLSASPWLIAQCEGAFLDANSALLTTLVLFAVAAFMFTLKRADDRLWDVTERQLKAALLAAEASQKSTAVVERALTTGQRAFVFFKHVTPGRVVDTRTNAVKYWTVTPIFENSGETPTKHMVGRLNYDFFDEAPPEEFDFPDKPVVNEWSLKKTPNFLGPKSTGNIGGSIFIGAEKMIDLAKNKLSFYFWGSIDYNDVFPETPRHRTEYCLQLVVEGDPSKAATDGIATFRLSTRYHHKHNAADDDCSRPAEPGVAMPEHGAEPHLA